MNVSKVRLSQLLLVLLIFLSATAAGTTRSMAEQDRPMLDLKSKDPRLHTEQGYASVLFWSLRLEDRTGDCAGFYPRFTFGPPGSAARVASGRLVPMTPGEYFKTHYTASAIRGQWEKRGEVQRFDGLYAVEARPGQYELFQFKLHREKKEYGSLAFAVNLGEHFLETPSGQLLYLGEIEVTVLNKEPGSKGLLYNFLIRARGTDLRQSLERDLEAMKTLFPGIVAAFPSGANTVLPTAKGPLETTGEFQEKE